MEIPQMKMPTCKIEQPSVLIVDDNQGNILAIHTVIEELDVNIIDCLSGQDALRISYEKELALILLDVQMPEMDGFEVASLLQKNKKTKNIPIIFVTAISKEIEYVHKDGILDYIIK